MMDIITTVLLTALGLTILSGSVLLLRVKLARHYDGVAQVVIIDRPCAACGNPARQPVDCVQCGKFICRRHAALIAPTNDWICVRHVRTGRTIQAEGITWDY